MEKKERKLSTKKDIKAVTRNNFVLSGKPQYGLGLPDLSPRARKMLYLLISQVKRNDTGFYEYRVPITQFAELMDIPLNYAYEIARETADELTSLKLELPEPDGKGTEFVVACPDARYGKADCPNEFVLEFNYRMSELFLNIRHELFSQPMLDDLLKMHSKYSIQIWHLLKTKIDPSRKSEHRFYISLSDLRKVTDTEKKLTKLSNFKNRCLDVAIREIEEICFVKIQYSDKREGRKTTGFNFVVSSVIKPPTEQEFSTDKVAEIKAKAARVHDKAKNSKE